MSESEDNNEPEFNNLHISRSQTNLLRVRYELARYYQRHIEECEDQIVPETNNNPNFMHEKDMKYNLYPLYINWKKVEANKYNYFDMFVHFGYFGAAVYSSLDDVYSNITNKNIIYVFSTFCYFFLVNENENEEQDKNDKDLVLLISKLPEKKQMYNLIKKKVMMFKEMPIYLIVLKIYEIYYLFNDQMDELVELLKYEFRIISYITDDEYNEIFQNSFKGDVSSIFKKLVKLIGKQLELPNTRNKYLNHIKYIYQLINKNKKEEVQGENVVNSGEGNGDGNI